MGQAVALATLESRESAHQLEMAEEVIAVAYVFSYRFCLCA